MCSGTQTMHWLLSLNRLKTVMRQSVFSHADVYNFTATHKLRTGTLRLQWNTVITEPDSILVKTFLLLAQSEQANIPSLSSLDCRRCCFSSLETNCQEHRGRWDRGVEALHPEQHRAGKPFPAEPSCRPVQLWRAAGKSSSSAKEEIGFTVIDVCRIGQQEAMPCSYF